MPYQVPLLTSISQQCDSAGNCTIHIGPAVAATRWQVNLIQISNDTPLSSVNQPQMLMYLNGISVGGTYSGQLATDDTQYLLQPGDDLKLVWSGADPNSNCLATLSGIVYDQRNR